MKDFQKRRWSRHKFSSLNFLYDLNLGEERQTFSLQVVVSEIFSEIVQGFWIKEVDINLDVLL